MRNSGFLWIVVALMFLLDLYVFQALKIVLPVSSPRWRLTIVIAYWLIAILAIVVVAALPYLRYETWPKGMRTYVIAIIIGLFLGKLVASLFFIVDDIRRGGLWALGKLFNTNVDVISREGITRSAFLSWMGLTIGTGLFGTLLFGFLNKYRYQINRLQLAFENLPNSFRGLKIVHISDIHSGSFTDKEAVRRGVDKIIAEQPDLILFTGDLVNDRATEMQEYIEIFGQLKAPLGVYSVLGNHDYGDYVRWENEEAKHSNLRDLMAVHDKMGWRLLMNEHAVIEKDGEKIVLLGIENWGAKGRFSRYGKMEKAYPGTENYPFKILLSHDPSHWDAQVRTEYRDIDLMLAGHTHGMQFGLELPGIKWSPVQYMYKQWAGLYEFENQKLYVNRGFGFLGYPGRVGILPEITVIELA